MKLTTKTIKKIIKEEIKKILRESSEDINVNSVLNVQDGESGQLPLIYDEELMEGYSPSASALFNDYFSETLSEDVIQKLINLVDDDVAVFCLGQAGFQAQELIKAFDPKFKGIAVGSLIFDDQGDTGVSVQIGPNGLTIVKGQENIENNGKLRVGLGYGAEPDFDYNSIINPNHRMYDTYFSDMDTGSGGYGNQDVRGSVTVNINKIIEDVNSGKLGLNISGQYEGNITYKVGTPIY
jgi:hypothetical protein